MTTVHSLSINEQPVRDERLMGKAFHFRWFNRPCRRLSELGDLFSSVLQVV